VHHLRGISIVEPIHTCIARREEVYRFISMLFFNSGFANDNRFHFQLQLVLTKIKKLVYKVKKRGGDQLCTTVKDQKNERPVHNYNDKRL
jgi:hypothetical protein